VLRSWECNQSTVSSPYYNGDPELAIEATVPMLGNFVAITLCREPRLGAVCGTCGNSQPQVCQALRFQGLPGGSITAHPDLQFGHFM